MNTSVYTVNKAINKPVEFRGLKAQYIWYLGGGLIVLLIVFAALYFIGINTYICLALVGGGGSILFTRIYRMSHKYGQYGMLKKVAKRGIPRSIRSDSRKVFTALTLQRPG